MVCNQSLTKLEESNDMGFANELGALSNFFLALRRKESCRLWRKKEEA